MSPDRLCGICRHTDHRGATCAAEGCLCPSLHPTIIQEMKPALRAALFGWLVLELSTAIVAAGFFAAALVWLDILAAIALLFGPIGLPAAGYASLLAIVPVIAIVALTAQALRIPSEIWRERVSAA